MMAFFLTIDRKSTRLNSSHTVIYTLSLHDALPIYRQEARLADRLEGGRALLALTHERHVDHHDGVLLDDRSEEHTSELQSHRDLHSFPTRRSSDLSSRGTPRGSPRRRTRPPRADARAPRRSS